ncbi:hypothetical protein N7540_004499 [Penicillium herquei]|nr:hypothetical protein N7540_004499 [Penicillium herquei]
MVSKAPSTRNSLWPRPRKLLDVLFALAIVFTIHGIFSVWRLFRRPEHRKAVDELSHRLACSTYPEDCLKTAPFVFDSVYSLLKQWPNNYAPNGHSVIPATVAPNTLLYHARTAHGKLKSPTFFAFDAEMSLAIHGSIGTPVLHTMTTTKQLRVIYLDGHSATLTTTGTLDSQMAIIGNHVPADPSEDLTYNEDKRALELCQLANQLNIDGIDSSLPRDQNHQPPLGFGNDFAEQNGWEWVRSSTWHYGNGGGEGGGSMSEKRVRLDLCGFVSWYDPSLRSLSGSHHGGLRDSDTYENGWGLRRGHRLLEVTKDDIATFRGWLQTATYMHASEKKKSKCSNTDWQALIETIVDKYRTRAREILFNLEKDPSSTEAAYQIIINVYSLTHAILYPYLEYPAIVGMEKPEAKAQTLARCTAAYTGHIELDSLSEFEVLIKESTRLVLQRLCQWSWDLFEWTDSQMHNRLQYTSRLETSVLRNAGSIRQEIALQKSTTQSLLQWLGWDVWKGCDRKCAPNSTLPENDKVESMPGVS